MSLIFEAVQGYSKWMNRYHDALLQFSSIVMEWVSDRELSKLIVNIILVTWLEFSFLINPVFWRFVCFYTICDFLSFQTTKALQSQLQNLECMKVELTVTESQLEDWVSDVKEWADGEEMTSVCVYTVYIYVTSNTFSCN